MAGPIPGYSGFGVGTSLGIGYWPLVIRPLVLAMRFLAPAAFFCAAAIPVVILFYLLKRKRVVRLVSSTLLWQKFLAETQAGAPFQRLRHHWLLVLQIILLLLT